MDRVQFLLDLRRSARILFWTTIFVLAVLPSFNIAATIDRSDKVKPQPSHLFSKAGTIDFRELVVSDGAFVDKTLLIDKYLRNKESLMLLTRPRRFGKTINADMIRRFLQMEVDPTNELGRQEIHDNYKLFAGGSVPTESGELKTLQPLKISYSEFSMKHQGQWPVLYVSFNQIVGNNSEWIEDSFGAYVGQLFARYEFLRDKLATDADRRTFDAYRSGNASSSSSANNDQLLETSLNFLATQLSQHCNRKVHLILDDYDAPILKLLIGLADQPSGDYGLQHFQEAANSADFRGTVNFIRTVLVNTFKNVDGRSRLEKALVIGVLPIDDVLTGIGLKSFSKSFCDFYGFSLSEVDSLISMTDIDPRSIGHMEAWYGGYANMGKVAFNTYSVPKVLQWNNRKGDCYLRNLTNAKFIRQILSVDEIQLELSKIINGSSVVSALDNVSVKFEYLRRRSIYHMLMFFGYLTPDRTYPDTEVRGELKVPNEEVKIVLKDSVIKWASRAFNLSEERIKELGQMLLDGKKDQFEEAAKESFKKGPKVKID